MTSVTLTQVSSSDASPTNAPYRISGKAGHDAATVIYVVATSNAAPIRALRVVYRGASRRPTAPAKLLTRLGVVCGLDVIGPASLPLAMPSGTQRTLTISYPTAAAPDGDQTVSLHALGDEGWS